MLERAQCTTLSALKSRLVGGWGMRKGWNSRGVGNVTKMYNSGGQDNKGASESYEKL